VSASNLTVTADDSLVADYIGWKLRSDPFSNYIANDIANDYMTATITGAVYAASSANTYTIQVPYFQRTKQGKQWYFNSPAVVAALEG